MASRRLGPLTTEECRGRGWPGAEGGAKIRGRGCGQRSAGQAMKQSGTCMQRLRSRRVNGCAASRAHESSHSHGSCPSQSTPPLPPCPPRHTPAHKYSALALGLRPQSAPDPQTLRLRSTGLPDSPAPERARGGRAVPRRPASLGRALISKGDFRLATMGWKAAH